MADLSCIMARSDRHMKSVALPRTEISTREASTLTTECIVIFFPVLGQKSLSDEDQTLKGFQLFEDHHLSREHLLSVAVALVRPRLHAVLPILVHHRSHCCRVQSHISVINQSEESSGIKDWRQGSILLARPDNQVSKGSEEVVVPLVSFPLFHVTDVLFQAICHWGSCLRYDEGERSLPGISEDVCNGMPLLMEGDRLYLRFLFFIVLFLCLIIFFLSFTSWLSG